MLIVGQDGNMIFDMTGATVRVAPRGSDVIAYRQEDGEAYEVLGKYPTEQRAKEVLWEIADEYEEEGMVYDMPLV